MPGIQLAPDRDQALTVGSERGELLDHVGCELLREEAHLVALGLERELAERIPCDDLGELIPRADHDVDVEPELLGDHPPAPRGDVVRGLVGREDSVPALQIRRDVREARLDKQLAKPPHRDPVPGADVDAAQEDDLAHGPRAQPTRATRYASFATVSKTSRARNSRVRPACWQ